MSERLTYTVEEAGRLCGIGRAAAYAACRSGDLPAVRLGRRWVIPRARLLALLSDDGDALAEPLDERRAA